MSNICKHGPWKPEDLFKDGAVGFVYEADTNISTNFHADGTRTTTYDPYGAERKTLKEQLAAKDAEITHLQSTYARFKDLLRQIAYPRRGTDEEKMDIFDAAKLIQANFTMADLDDPVKS